MKKLLVISGSTATGKTSLAISIARKMNGELISADSRQVYIGMDIGTGKDIPKSSKFIDCSSQIDDKNKLLSIGYREKEGIPIWLVDIVKPDYTFNVGEYTRLAKSVIAHIHKKNKLPILVGGTHLYLKSVAEQLPYVTIPPIMMLREQLYKAPILEVQQKLEKIDPQKWQKMNRSDRHNPRRLVRYIEIAIWKKRHTPLLLRKDYNDEYDALWIGLKSPTKIMYRKINQRVDERLRFGIIEEVTSLLDQGYSWDLPALSAIGYQEWRMLYEKSTLHYEMTKQELIAYIIDRWKMHENKYARRQMESFTLNKKIKWFDSSQKDWIKQIRTKINKWYNK